MYMYMYIHSKLCVTCTRVQCTYTVSSHKQVKLHACISLRAAFQYGVKMNDGRKTRRYGGLSDKAREKAKLNREWQQISQVRIVKSPLSLSL